MAEMVTELVKMQNEAWVLCTTAQPNADLLVGSKQLPYIQIGGAEALGGLPALNLLENCVCFCTVCL